MKGKICPKSGSTLTGLCHRSLNTCKCKAFLKSTLPLLLSILLLGIFLCLLKSRQVRPQGGLQKMTILSQDEIKPV